MQLQALLDDKRFDIEIDGQEVSVDGAPVDLRITRLSDDTMHLLVDGRSYVCTAERVDEKTVRITHAGRSRDVQLKSDRDLLLERLGMDSDAELTPTELKAPMPGLVLQVLVGPGDEVDTGAGLVVLEAMKMENELRAELPGTVAQVHVEPGAAVTKGDLLVSFE